MTAGFVGAVHSRFLFWRQTESLKISKLKITKAV
jgi:hypothetical protein